MDRLGTGLTGICGVVAAPTAREMVADIRSALRETPTVELRLDWLTSDAERSKLLAYVAKRRPQRAPFLVTCRRKGRIDQAMGGA